MHHRKKFRLRDVKPLAEGHTLAGGVPECSPRLEKKLWGAHWLSSAADQTRAKLRGLMAMPRFGGVAVGTSWTQFCMLENSQALKEVRKSTAGRKLAPIWWVWFLGAPLPLGGGGSFRRWRGQECPVLVSVGWAVESMWVLTGCCAEGESVHAGLIAPVLEVQCQAKRLSTPHHQSLPAQVSCVVVTAIGLQF